MNPDCCHPYLNRADQLPRLVAQLRGAYGRHLGEPAWTGFVCKLQAASPEFARLWAEHNVAGSGVLYKVFRHPAHERLVLTTTSLAVNTAPGTRIVVCLPADEACRQAIAGLLAGEGADAHYPCAPVHRQRRAELAAAGRLTPVSRCSAGRPRHR